MWKIGPRLWKTGLAVAAALTLLRWLGLPAEFGAVAAALAVAPSAGRSLRQATHQIGANLLGGLVGGVTVLVFGPNPVVIGLTLVGLLYLCARMKWTDVSNALIMVTVFVMAPHKEGVTAYLLWRILSVALGAIIGTVINAFVMPPDYWPQLMGALERAGEKLDGFILAVTERLEQPAAFTKAEILASTAEVEKAIGEVRRLYLLVGESDRSERLAARKPLVQRAVKVQESLLERILVIHKAALTAVSAADYPQQLALMQNALRELVSLRRALYGRLQGANGPESLAADLERIERTFETTAGVPACSEEVEVFFRLHRMRSGISHMANRLGRLQVACDGALRPESEGRAVILPAGGD